MRDKIDTTAVRDQLDDLPAVEVRVLDPVGFNDDVTVVRITQDLGTRNPLGPLVYFVPLPGRLIAMLRPRDLARYIAAAAGSQLRPWLRPDPPLFPRIRLLPFRDYRPQPTGTTRHSAGSHWRWR
jgi:hypothetical protein